MNYIISLLLSSVSLYIYIYKVKTDYRPTIWSSWALFSRSCFIPLPPLPSPSVWGRGRNGAVAPVGTFICQLDHIRTDNTHLPDTLPFSHRVFATTPSYISHTAPWVFWCVRVWLAVHILKIHIGCCEYYPVDLLKIFTWQELFLHFGKLARFLIRNWYPSHFCTLWS